MNLAISPHTLADLTPNTHVFDDLSVADYFNYFDDWGTLFSYKTGGNIVYSCRSKEFPMVRAFVVKSSMCPKLKCVPTSRLFFDVTPESEWYYNTLKNVPFYFVVINYGESITDNYFVVEEIYHAKSDAVLALRNLFNSRNGAKIFYKFFTKI